MFEMWNKIKEFCSNAWAKVKAWWNEEVSDEEMVTLVETYPDGIPAEKLYKNPIRQKYEWFKAKVSKSVGSFGMPTILICVGVIGFILFTGGNAVLSVVGISLATIAGAFIAVQRFPKLEAFIVKYFKIIDLALFAFMFLAANTIFGLQVAAITGVTASIGLILWKVWKDNENEMKVAASKMGDAIADTFSRMSGNTELVVA